MNKFIFAQQLMVFLFSVISTQAYSASRLDEGQISKAKFPHISGVNGQVQITGKNKKTVTVKINEILREKAIIQTQSRSQIRIELDEKNGIILLENSSLELPVIGFDQGEVTDVALLWGQLRVQSRDGNERFYSTPITKDVMKNADFLLEYDMARAIAKLTVFLGQLNFRGLENERSADVASGESVQFHGVLENNEPAYDILLRGRKVARGELSAKVQKLSESDLKQLQAATNVNKPDKPKGPVKPPRKPGQICDEPYGMMNECVWRCQGLTSALIAKFKLRKCDIEKVPSLQCVRQRCNANGKWEDNFTLPAGQNRCGLKPEVGACDY